jgi:lipocalin
MEWLLDYCNSKGIPFGRSYLKKVRSGYKLKENEKWTDRNLKNRVEVIEEKGICCDIETRDALNLIYFLDLERYQPEWPWRWGPKEYAIFDEDFETKFDIIKEKSRMTLYLSGNFPQLSKIEKERAMAERIQRLGYDYHRLMTFYYRKDCETILEVAKGLEEGI